MSSAKTFELPRVGDGAMIALCQLLKERRGAVVVFWSAVCSHCRRYDAYLNDFTTRHPLALAVIGCRDGESAEHLEAARAQRGLDFPLLHDVGDTARDWRVRQTPTVFLLGPCSKVIYRGAIDDFTYPDATGHRAYLEDAITSLLAGKEVELASTSAFGCPTESVYYQLPRVIGRGGDA